MTQKSDAAKRIAKAVAMQKKEDAEQAVNRYKAAPVEDYKPLYKQLHKLVPLEERY